MKFARATCVLTLFILIGLVGCTKPAPVPPIASESSGDVMLDERKSGNSISDSDNDLLAGTTYKAVHGTSDCTQDCSGHNAGYNWAEGHNISNPIECSGNSESFIEGCRAYANDQKNGHQTDVQ